MTRPLIAFGASFFLTILSFAFLPLKGSAVVFVLSSCLFIISLILFFVFKKRIPKYRVLASFFIVVFAGAALSSFLFSVKYTFDYKKTAAIAGGGVKTLSGKIKSYDSDYGRYFYTLKDVYVNGHKIKGEVAVNSPFYIEAGIDDVLSVKEALIYDLTDGETGYKMADGVYLGAYPGNEFSLKEASRRGVNFYINSLKDKISSILKESLGEKYSWLSNALLTGDKTDIDPRKELNFRYSGLSHLFAVSGFHLSLWTGILGLAFLFLPRKYKNIGNVLTLIFILFFEYLTGFTKSVVRAGLMLAISVLSRFTKYQADSLNSLFIALTVILIINPFSAFSVSLQMSFLASLGIIAASRPLMSPVYDYFRRHKNKKLKKAVISVSYSIAVSISAAVFTFPVSIFTFGYFTPLSVLSNFLCLVPAELTMVFSGLGCVLSFFKPLSKLFFALSAILSEYLFFITEKLSSLPFSIINCDNLYVLLPITVVLASFFILFAVFRKNKRKVFKVSVICLLSFSLVTVYSYLFNENVARVILADVGNGLSAVYHKGGLNIMAGCGGDSGKGYKLTSACDKLNIREFDALFVLGSDKKSSAYLYDVASDYNVDLLVSPRGSLDYPKELFNSVIKENYYQLNAKGAKISFFNEEKRSFLKIEQDGFSCLVILKGGYNIPKELLKGDLLITSGGINNIDTSGFKNVFVSSKEEVYERNVYGTRLLGGIELNLYPDGKYVVKNSN